MASSEVRGEHLLRRAERWLIEYEDVSLSVFLALLCILSFGLLPFLDLTGLTGRLVSFAYTLLFVVGTFIGGLTGAWRVTAFVLAGLSIATTWLGDETGRGFWNTAGQVTWIVFMALVCVQLIREVFRPGEVNGHRIRGGIAVYLLIGFLFGLGYRLLETLQPGSFTGIGSGDLGVDLDQAIYFSFVTLTTLGFGDITPVRDLAQTLVVVEAIIGQLFLAVLIGRLVSLSTAGSAST